MSECRRPPPTLLTKSTSTVCAGIEPTFPHRQCGALDLWTNRPFARLCVTNLTIYVRPVIASHNRFILYVASFEPTNRNSWTRTNKLRDQSPLPYRLAIFLEYGWLLTTWACYIVDYSVTSLSKSQYKERPHISCLILTLVRICPPTFTQQCELDLDFQS